ncbi:MAG: hypothetical protein HY815_15790, partial [Candidatus Riflebacteria bacterium]|nr:hypothetical protein [Candidatus Riflebacteria bacterium]
MQMVRDAVIVLVLIVVIFIASQSCFIVTEWEHAVVTRFGNPVKVVLARVMKKPEYALRLDGVQAQIKAAGVSQIIVGPGIHFKTPFIERVKFFDSRANLYVSQPYDIVTGDKKKIHLDNFALWRIENPLVFWQTVQDDYGARSRLDAFVFSN